MAAVINAFKEYWDDMLAVGVGIVLTDVVGDQVKEFLTPIVGDFIEPKWMDAIVELMIGVTVLFIGEMWVPTKWKAYSRLASFGAIGIGLANVVGTAIGLIPGPERAVTPRGRPTKVAPSRRVAPKIAPEIFS